MGKPIIPLAAAHVTQVRFKDGKLGDWQVEENETNKRLFSLPKHFSVHDVEKSLEFARKYELEALNIGINHGKKITEDIYKKALVELNAKLESLKQLNERLSEALDKEQRKNN